LVTPLNPRIQPLNVVSVFSLYVIISSSIFKIPYEFGNPFVEFTTIVVCELLIDSDKVTDPPTTSGVRLSNFKYWSKFSTISVGPP